MSRKFKIGVLAVALVVTSAFVAATAFTSGQVDRQANVNVVSDDTGLIGLEDGTSGPLVNINSSGALEIDFANETGSGVNPEATYELGNTNDPTNQTAFNITNNAGDSLSLTITFEAASGFSDSGDADSNLKFVVYDSSGTKVGTVSEESTSLSKTLSAGSTLYVVIVVDTHGLTKSDDLSGNLNVSA